MRTIQDPTVRAGSTALAETVRIVSSNVTRIRAISNVHRPRIHVDRFVTINVRLPATIPMTAVRTAETVARLSAIIQLPVVPNAAQVVPTLAMIPLGAVCVSGRIAR